MHSRHPRVSFFTLTDGEPLIRRQTLQEQRKMIRPQSIINHQSIIRHTKKASHHQRVQRHRNSNIRLQLDNQLDKYCIIRQKQSHCKTNASTIDKSSSFVTENVPDLNNDLVLNYVQTVFKDYNIRNRFQRLNTQEKLGPKKGLDIMYSHQRRNTQVNGSADNGYSNNRRRRFLSLTNQSKISKNTQYYKQSRQTDQNALPVYRSPQSPKNSTVHYSKYPYYQTSIKRTQYLYQKIKEHFKYCIICQKKILQANIDYHQQLQCSQFRQLYKLSFQQLNEIMQNKINRIRQVLRQHLNDARQKRYNTVRNNQELIDLMEAYVQSGLNAKDKHYIFSQFSQNKQIGLNEQIQLTQKLRYFQQIHEKLVAHQQLLEGTGKLSMLDFSSQQIQRSDYRNK